MAQPVIRIRGHLKPADVARLVKKGREPRLDELLRLFKDQYGYGNLELEVELHLNPDVDMKRKEQD